MKIDPGKLLSTDLSSPQSIPYFLWDEPMTVAEFKSRLQTASMAEQTRLLAKMLREARDRCLAVHLTRRSLAALARTVATTG